ncbi:hypothetical protein V8G54_035182 [Vigna mungo]|uniref:Uncharacterized protein n=1 Tax=Vigna mungo TaxID=3915 RepID=A0AAQ3RE45_VIGMU
MSTTNEIQVMFRQKFSHLIRAKGVGHSSVIHSPTLHIPTRIRPKQITKQASVGNCSRTDYIPDFIQVCEFRGKTTMHAQYFIIYKGSHRKAVKTLGEGFPKPHIKPSLTFIIKPINPINGSTLMIPPQQEKVFWIFDFICKQKTYGF